MNICIFSDHKNIAACFTAIEKSKNYTVEYYPAAEVQKKLKELSRNIVFYIDISSYDEKEKNKILKYIFKLKSQFMIKLLKQAIKITLMT